MWNPVWNTLHASGSWGGYPSEDVIRFVARNFYSAPDRGAVNLLDLGCSNGTNLWFMAREGFNATGIDGSDVAIAGATKFLAEKNLHAQLDVGDILEMDYPENSFDGVVDHLCLDGMVLADFQKVCKTVRRILKPNGLFFSKQLMAGSTGETTGEALEGEPHTYMNPSCSFYGRNSGVFRYTTEEQIPNLCPDLELVSYDLVTRTDGNREVTNGEWLITWRKPA